MKEVLKKPYTVGIDFGTLSGRCVLLDTRDGRELAESVLAYPHAVMDETLPSGKPLAPQSALQHPQDYLDVLRTTVPEVLRQAGITPSEVAGIGIDFTACTMLPVDKEGRPLCFLPEFADEPQAYVKLWKHHASNPEADEINALAEARGEAWLQIYGGRISPEWMLPKILETLHHAPAVYAAADRFTEAGDWLSRVLTGVETHSASFAGYKALWNSESGYPDNAFFKALHPAMDGIVGSKLSTAIYDMQSIAGKLSQKGAELVGLCEGTPLSLPQLDAHAAMPALGIAGAGDLMIIVGTSGCHILNSETCKPVPGICGYVKDGIIPGLYTFEAGQAAVGDIFDWFVRTGVPAAYAEEAAARGISLHKLLREKASRLRVGESGLLALDWHNGNRCTLGDLGLSGLLLGQTLGTKPEEIYRAYIEATAYGTRMIVENFEANGISVGDIVAAGGIAQKDEMMMQIYADVLGREIKIAGSTQAGARGSAIYAAVAGGLYKGVAEAARALGVPVKQPYRPNAADADAYEAIYAEYKTLYNYFGRENLVMKRLRSAN